MDWSSPKVALTTILTFMVLLILVLWYINDYKADKAKHKWIASVLKESGPAPVHDTLSIRQAIWYDGTEKDYMLRTLVDSMGKIIYDQTIKGYDWIVKFKGIEYWSAYKYAHSPRNLQDSLDLLSELPVGKLEDYKP